MLRPIPAVFAAIVAILSAALPAKGKTPMTDGVVNASLAAAGRRATLKDIDYGSTTCDAETGVAAWLKALTERDARTITWTGGKCQLVNDLNPLDRGSRWCAQATISLVHPKDRKDKPMIEIYLEAPKHGRPGAAYAFRSLMMTRDGDPDYLRSRKDFEAAWRERFPSTSPPACRD